MALVRCKGCGNPVSTKSKACPICGEPLAAESAPTTIADVAVESQAKTLNDIIAERQREQTLNDVHTEAVETPKVEAAAEDSASEREVVAPVAYDVPAHEESHYAGDADVDDLMAEIERSNRSLKGYKLIALVLFVLLIPAAYFGVTYGLKFKTIEGDYAIVESARQLFEEQNSMLQRDAESLVTELESLKDQNDTMMVKYQEAVVMLEQLQKEKTYNYNQLAKYRKEAGALAKCEEDVLSYALFPQVATKFFQWRQAQQLKADPTAFNKADGTMPV